jgi:hypothetical protein
MNPLFTLALFAALCITSGCSDEQKEPEADKKDHFLRQPIDTMNDAKAVRERMDQTTKAKEEQAEEITGH